MPRQQYIFSDDAFCLEKALHLGHFFWCTIQTMDQERTYRSLPQYTRVRL